MRIQRPPSYQFLRILLICRLAVLQDTLFLLTSCGLSRYPGGTPTVSTISDLNEVTWPDLEDNVYSARILGSFMPPYKDGELWDISCNISGISAFLYLDDHLVCQGGNDPAAWADNKPERRVPWPGTPSSAGKPYFLRLRLVHRPGPSNGSSVASFSMLYSVAYMHA